MRLVSDSFIPASGVIPLWKRFQFNCYLEQGGKLSLGVLFLKKHGVASFSIATLTVRDETEGHLQ